MSQIGQTQQNQQQAQQTQSVDEGLVKVSRSALEFNNKYVEMFHGVDFDLDSSERVKLRKSHDACYLVFFYIENQESYDIAILFSRVASRISGPRFAAVNLIEEREVAEAFTYLISNRNHPLHWAGLRQSPVIFVYRGTYPVAVYNGERNTQALTDYAMTMACNVEYIEQAQAGISVALNPENQLGIPNMLIGKTVQGSEQLTSPLREYGKTAQQGGPSNLHSVPPVNIPRATNMR